MSDKLPKYDGPTVSEDFEDAFSDHCSGSRRRCACGRECYDSSGNFWDWEEGELESLEAKHKAEPDRYIALDYACTTMTLMGRECVMGCPCNGARGFEEFLIANASQIASYLNKRAERLEAKAQAMKVKDVNEGR